MRQVVPLCSQLGAVLLLVLTALVLVWITKISRIQGCQSMRFPWDFMSSHFWLLILLDTPWYTRQDTRDIPVTRSSCPWCSWVSDLVNGRSTIQTSKILNTSVTSVLKQQLKTRHHCSYCSQVTFIATWQCGFQWLPAAWDMDPRSLCFVRNKNHPSKSWSYGLLHMQGRFPLRAKWANGPHSKHPIWPNCWYHEKIGRWRHIYDYLCTFRIISINFSMCRETNLFFAVPHVKSMGQVPLSPQTPQALHETRMGVYLMKLEDFYKLGKIHKYNQIISNISLISSLHSWLRIFRHWTFNMNTFVPAWTLRYLRYLRSRLCSTASEFHSPREPAKG